MGSTGRRRSSTRRWLVAAAAAAGMIVLEQGAAYASAGEGADAFSALLIGLAIILPFSRISGLLAERFGQPAVLGELLLGIVLGNISLLGWNYFDVMAADHGLTLLAELGVVLLLFEVGIDSSLGKLLKVGVPSFLVAVVGVILPMVFGYAAGRILLPDASPYTALFLGATLTATSVGITARVLKDLGKLQAAESQIVLGAAVIDDVLGLIVLAVVSGLVTAADAGQTMELSAVAYIFGKAVVFLVGALVLGLYLGSHAFVYVTRRGSLPMLFAAALALCFGLAWGAGQIGLAPIVGAFAAGLILEGIPWQRAGVSQDQVIDLLHPFSITLVPVFFVMTGMKVDLAAAANLRVLELTALLTVIAFVGKFAAGWAAFGPYNKVRIGVGMVPRGEVGLIFANIGERLTLGGKPLLSPDLFSALVLVIFISTLITPPALRVVFQKK